MSLPRSRIDWEAWRRGAEWPGSKRVGSETRGPCPVLGAGTDTCHVRHDAELAGCRKCGDGAGGLTADQLVEHARAAGAIMVDLGAGGGSWGQKINTWVWTAADGRTREQYRWSNHHDKTWQPTEPVNDPPPRELLYLPGGAVPTGPGPVHVCEGASDTDAAHAAGLGAVGRTGARPSAASLARLDKTAVYRPWPDHDAAGYRQAATWADAAKRAGLTVEVIDPLKLWRGLGNDGEPPDKWDARDWLTAAPAETRAAALDAAVVDPAVIRDRTGPAPVVPFPVTPVAGAELEIVPTQHVRMCFAESDLAKLIAETAAGRLRHVAESGEWLTWRDRHGWRPITHAALLAAVALCGRENIGTRTKDGQEYLTPRLGGRAATAAGVLRELAGWHGIESAAAEWDRDPGLVGLPGANVLDVRTGQQRPMTRDNLIRRRLAAAPVDADAFKRSRFASVIRHVVPDAAEREYLARRLGAALLATVGLDDLIWLSGASGSGKGVCVEAWRAAFGEYAAVLPISELTAGGHRGHLQWLAKLYGARVLFADDVPPRALDVGVFNRLLGSVLSAHHMRRGSFDFTLTAPILATSNYPPQVDAADAGFRRRLKPIAAGQAIPEPDQDPAVRASMSTPAESGAVIRWLCKGARAFLEDGCPVPESIRTRTADVVAGTPLAEFVATFTPGEWIESGEVWRRWQSFKTERGERPGGRKPLMARLESDHGWRRERGYVNGQTVRGWRVSDASDALKVYPYTGRPAPSCRDIDPTRPTRPNLDEFPPGALSAPVDQGAGGGGQPTGNPEPPPPALGPTVPDGADWRRGRIVFREGGEHAGGCDLPADHAGPCWIPEPPPEPLTADERQRLAKLPADADAQSSTLGKLRAAQAALGLPVTPWTVSPDSPDVKDAARAVLAAFTEAARRADVDDTVH